MVDASHFFPTRRIAVLLRDRSPGWFSEKVSAAAIQKLSRSGCLVRTVCTANNRRKGEKFLRWLKCQEVDAALDNGFHWLGHPRRPIRASEFPLVYIGPPHSSVIAPSVGVDGAAVSRLALDHLQSVGYRSCGYLITSGNYWVRQRFEPFVELARKRGLWDPACLVDLRPKLGRHPTFTVELGELPALKRALRAAKKPVGFCSHNDFAAASLLDWLLRNGYAVPAEVGVVGCDDDPMYALANVGLTTVHLPVEELGDASAELLLQLLRNPAKTQSAHRWIQPTLVVRASTVARSGPGRWLLDVIGAIQSNLASKHFGEVLGACTGWSYDTVARRFKAAMGCTILGYRDQQRLDRAAELLRQKPRLKIDYVCHQVGFTSAGRFAAAFRERHGRSPREFQTAHAC